MKKLEMSYNQSQRVWMDKMIAACRVMIIKFTQLLHL